MIRRAAPLLLLLLAACHRGRVADVTLDEDAQAQNATHDKALADIAAAEAAARQPMPPRAAIEPPPPAPPVQAEKPARSPAPLLPPAPVSNDSADVTPQG